MFNKPLNNLPQNLKYLYIYGLYTHSLDYLPEGLIKLTICGNFNKYLDKLHSSLKILSILTYFGNDIPYTQKLDNLPLHLNFLNLNSSHRNTGTYEYLKIKHKKLTIRYIDNKLLFQ
jgi:hypothetical protein